jgi:putative flippase GtrA
MNYNHALQTLLRRLMSRHLVEMLVRNTVVGTSVFALDLLLLWALVEGLAVNKLVAATIGFVTASSLHYTLGRSWIFRGTSRHVLSGYFYFLINAGVGLAITILMFAAFIHWTTIDYLVARVIVSLFAGLATFLLNALFNFRSV